MKQLLLILLSLNFLSVEAQTSDSIKPASITIQSDSLSNNRKMGQDQFEGTDDFSPGLLFFALIGLCLICLSIGVGTALTVIGLLVLFGLISAGILSTSIIVGLNKKSFAKGFKT